MDIEFEAIVARITGRPLDPSRQGAIQHLNDVPEDLIEDARKLGVLAAEQFLDYYTSSACRPLHIIKLYVQDVVFGGESPRTWMRGRVLTPWLSLEDHLRLRPERLLAHFGNAFAVRVKPSFSNWQVGGPFDGAPALVQLDSDYLTPIPEGTTTLALPRETEPVSDPVVALRRWHASRLAFMTWKSGALGRARGLEDLSLPNLPISQWTEDARVAGAALLRENRELGPWAEEIPGFRGPDAWFRGEL